MSELKPLDDAGDDADQVLTGRHQKPKVHRGHTTGPWNARLGRLTGGGKELALLRTSGQNAYEIDANANLIAAAPDLLAALKLVRSQFASLEHSEAGRAVIAAIAKAEGGQS